MASKDEKIALATRLLQDANIQPEILTGIVHQFGLEDITNRLADKAIQLQRVCTELEGLVGECITELSPFYQQFVDSEAIQESDKALALQALADLATLAQMSKADIADKTGVLYG